MTDESQKEAQEKALIYQILQAQMEELSNQSSALQTRLLELEVARSGIKDMEKTNDGSDILVPLGAGCYCHGSLAKKGRFMVEIGAGYLEEKDIAGALSLIEQKRKDFEDVAEKIEAEMEHMRASMDRIGLDLNAMAKKPKEEPEAEEEQPEEKPKPHKSSDIIVE